MKLVQPIYWPKLGSDVLPMRDHVAEIAELLGPENMTRAKSRRGVAAASERVAV